MTSPESSAVFFHPDAIEDGLHPVIGRRVAGSSFLRAYLAYAPGDTIKVVTQSEQHSELVQSIAPQLGSKRPLEIFCLDRGDDFTKAGTIFLPDPSFRDLPWRRQRIDPRGCSFVSITHAVSTQRVASSLRELLLAPTESWDAVICTSHAVQSALQTQLDLYGAYFSQRFQAANMPMPQLPIIPLGIDDADFAPRESRTSIRLSQGASHEDLVVLSVGRMSSVEKAHPIPMFKAVERMAKEVDQPVKLWLFGWTANDDERALFENAARQICRTAEVKFIDGNDLALRHAIWSGADIFTVPVDSLQETFGLVPVEAMAAGLPTVMPNWDGLRDTVVHGETGFLVPTRMTRPGGGQMLADRYFTRKDSYLQYLSLAQQQVAIDQNAYDQALIELARNPDLRRKMGEAGRARVAGQFTWKSIVGNYAELVRELHQMRQAMPVSSPPFRRGAPAPEAVDPFTLFASYPSHTLQPGTEISVSRPVTAENMETWDDISGRRYYARWLAPNETVATIAQHIHDNGPTRFDALCLQLDIRETTLEGIVLMLAKAGLARFYDP